MQHYSLGAHPPLSPALPGEIRGTLPAHLPGHLSANWCPTSGKHTGPAAGIAPRRGFEQGFSSRESGHFRICRKEFGLCLNPSHKVAARGGLTAVGVRREPPARRRDRRPGDRPGCVSLWWPAGGGPRPWRGRLAQRESASFTPRRSLVRSQYRPPRSPASSPRGTGLRRLSCRNGCSCHRPSRLCAPRRTPYPALRICSRRMSACPQCWANSRRVCR
jgi:hypothetical protein